ARIEHYTGIEIDTVQKFILFTNYAMHTTEFVRFGLSQLAQEDSRYTAMVLPNGETLHSDDAVNVDYEQLTLTSRFQMPRFDLVTAAGDGITMINIGVGPSNAKTITDCLAVLRPEAWIMIGHCAGLDGRMRIGDLILGNAYQREDNLLDGYVGAHNPIPAIPEVQRMLEASVDEIYGTNKTLMRTGTVLSTDDRNWEWRTSRQLWEWLKRPPRLLSTWSHARSLLMAIATAFLTARCCRYQTFLCTRVRSWQRKDKLFILIRRKLTRCLLRARVNS